MVLDFYAMAIAIDYAIGYTIGYTIEFQKCYDMSYFICNTCNVNAYANGMSLVMPLAITLAMPSTLL